MKMNLIILLGLVNLTLLEAARILICVPFPSISHQVVFYPLVKEFLKRNHEVVFITTDPIYEKGKAPANLTEIDTHDVTYNLFKDHDLTTVTHQGNPDDLLEQIPICVPLVAKAFVVQMETSEVQELIKNKTHFDLLIVEGITKSAQALSHVFKAPMIVMNSLAGIQNNYHVMGAPIFPRLLYPIFWHSKLNNLSFFDKVKVLWDMHKIESFYETLRIQEDINVKRLFGPDTPLLEELGNNVDMLFLNVYPIWEFNRPVPPGILYIGGIHQKPVNELPQDLKTYLDSSKRGVVYFSMGTNVSPSMLSAKKIRAIKNGLARLNYDVIIKWDYDDLPGKGNNTKVVKWLPQSDFLRHPKVKAFVTQGGLQSFDEALTGGVPLVGIPMFADQWYNVERYVSLKIGVGITEELTEDILVDAINTVIDDQSYRKNMIALRERLHDQPESALQRAVWWAEHVMRHGGGAHLRAPAANMPWTEFLDLQLWVPITLFILGFLVAVCFILYLLFQQVLKLCNRFVKHKVD